MPRLTKMIAAITNSLIKTLKPSKERYDVRDTTLKGFMVRVFPSGKMSYRCQYTRGKHITLGDVNVLKAAEARDEAKKILGDYAKGIDPAQVRKEARLAKEGVMTFNRFLDEVYEPWLNVHRADTAHDTLRSLRNSFNQVIGNLPLDEIAPMILEKWRVKRFKEDGVMPKTVNRQVALLKAALSRAKKWGFISAHPLADFEMAKSTDTSRVRYLTQDEYKRLLKAIDRYEQQLVKARERGNQWREARGYELMPNLSKQRFASDLAPKILLSLASGMRQCELRRIRREKHIYFAQQGLNLTKEVTKTKKPRFIPLDDQAWQVLMDWLAQTKATIGEKGLVFPGEDGKKPFDNMKKSWKTVLKMAEIENFTWHDMRHDYASQLVMAGVDLNTVRELLGHADIKMTLVYAHLAPEHKRKAIEKLQHRRSGLLTDE
ncbi:MAG: recombinase [Gammaproteobacteria bacterium CG11_big_fil_rev_8_21_14_0_20_46_22]|nr:MAG: recombinase [Gammaproteobacteria bacterium CG12_big_fil_rev_8_21_14_0_65_46_12]PIR11749.1 MAG: recombinase [Gammaproteobacteria bacterium CG11_big_fil_rev_8_21_14_0_20_46_22]